LEKIKVVQILNRHILIKDGPVVICNVKRARETGLPEMPLELRPNVRDGRVDGGHDLKVGTFKRERN
jgi:hypothetical protein